MLNNVKGKDKVPETKLLIVGFEQGWGIDLGSESGEELETFRSEGFCSEEEEGKGGDENKYWAMEEKKPHRESEVRIFSRKITDILKPISSSSSSRKDVDAKMAELEFEPSICCVYINHHHQQQQQPAIPSI